MSSTQEYAKYSQLFEQAMEDEEVLDNYTITNEMVNHFVEISGGNATAENQVKFVEQWGTLGSHYDDGELDLDDEDFEEFDMDEDEPTVEEAVNKQIEEKLEDEVSKQPNATFNNVSALIKIYQDTTGASDGQMNYEVFDVIQKLGNFDNESIHTVIARQQWDENNEGDFVKTLERYKPTVEKESRGRLSVEVESKQGSEHEKAELLNLLIKGFSYITWLRMEKVVAGGISSITEEILKAGLKKAPEDRYVTDYAKQLDGVEVETDYSRLLFLCKIFLEGNMDTLKKVRGIENVITKNLEGERKKKEALVEYDKLSDDVIEEELKSIIDTILTRYKALLPTLFINKPKGVLVPEGVLVFNKERGTIELQRLFQQEAQQIFKRVSNTFTYNGSGALDHTESNIYNFNMDFDIFDKDYNLKVTYLPTFMLQLVEGLVISYDESGNAVLEDVVYNYNTYLKTIKEMLEIYIKNICIRVLENSKTEEDFYTILNKIKGDLPSAFVNVIFVNDFSRNVTIDLVFTLDHTMFDGDGGLKKVMNNLTKSMQEDLRIPIGDSQLVNNSVTNSIGKFLYAASRDNYVNDIMFSYEAIEKQQKAGYKPDLGAILIGRNMGGDDVTLNLKDNTKVVTSIMAGSRSGKGVQTLNILLTALGVGTPVMYADCKPDMSAIFWDLEKKYNVPILAIDGADDTALATGVSAVRPAKVGHNLPEWVFDVGLSPSQFRIIGYMKLISLLTAYGLTRDKITKPDEEYNGIKLIILDEINVGSAALKTLISSVKSKLKEAEKLPKDDSTKQEKVEYFTKLRTYLLETVPTSDVGALTDKTAGEAGLRIVTIGQSVTTNKLAVDGDRSTSNPYGRILRNAGYRILGVRHGSDDTLGIKSSKVLSNPKGLSYLGIPEDGSDKTNNDGAERPENDPARGYFALMGGVGEVGGEVYKSYLTLNENDIEKVYAGLTTTYDESRIQDVKGSFVGGILGSAINPARIYEKDLIKIVDGQPEPNRNIGFISMMETILLDRYGSKQKAEEAFKTALTTMYCDLYNMMRYAGLEYATVEDYLFDCSIGSIWSGAELANRVPIMRQTGQRDVGAFKHVPLSHSEVKDIVYNGADYTLPYNVATISADDGEGILIMPEPSVESADEEESNDYIQQPQQGLDDLFSGMEVHNESTETQTLPDKGHDEDDTNHVVDDTEEENGGQYNEEELYTQPDNYEQPYEEQVDEDIQQQPLFTPQKQEPIREPVQHFSTPQVQSPFEPKKQEVAHQQNQQQYQTLGGITDIVTVPMENEEHPFAVADGGVLSTVHAVMESSKIILKQIKAIVKDLKRVHTLHILKSGIAVNGIKLRLSYPQEILEQYPMDMAMELRRGDYTSQFNYKDLDKMPNIEKVYIGLAPRHERQLIDDFGLRKGTMKLLSKFKEIETFEVNGVDYLHVDDNVIEHVERTSGFRDKVANFFKMGKNVTDTVLPSLPMQRVMQNDTMRSMGKGALGATMIWGLFNVAIPVFGIYGLIAGALTAGNMYTNRKNRNK